MGLWDPLWRSVATTKGGGVVVRSAAQGKSLPCSCVWPSVGHTRKFTKIKGIWDSIAEVGGFAPNKFHILKLTTKFYKIPTIFGKI